MIVIQLREAMKAYKRQHGNKFTYVTLGKATGISPATLDAIENRTDYNTTIDTLDKICRELKTTPYDIIVFDPTKAQPIDRKAGGRKKTKKSKTARKGVKNAEKPKTAPKTAKKAAKPKTKRKAKKKKTPKS